ncbi:thioredoxin family protein [Paracnuella aquatica]|uniref:thioredoxin family protein n=1 Tax=Paracnuella aquatica TaxID=2268757 RepID=UPI000DEFE0D3|nr:thioredoxin family protein [Paracnuella aquatica]RPD48175.1 thioredoxin [Paracnuella aquatica]
MRTSVKHLLATALVLCSTTLFAQSEIGRSTEGQKIIKGFLTPEVLTSDTAFNWFAANQKGYTPQSAALKALTTQKDSVHFLVFAGTWCHDTQFILPKFFAFANAAGVQKDHITTVGVDESKKSQYNLTTIFNVDLVPTIIVLKGGKEMGRVVEYGRYGMFDKEIGEILAGKL